MITAYTQNKTNTNLSGDKSFTRRNSFAWALKGYRPTTGEVTQTLRSRHSQPFDDRQTVRDEARWLALYCTDEDYTLHFLMVKTGLRRNGLTEFCAYYGVDLRRRTLVGGIQ